MYGKLTPRLITVLLIAFCPLAYGQQGGFGDADAKEPRTANRTNQPNPALRVGDAAPVFKLKSLDGKSETDLASFHGKKPVVLIFGSYT
jgi:hypothetical protein